MHLTKEAVQYNRDFPPKMYLYVNNSLTYKIISIYRMFYFWTYLSNSQKHWWWEAEKHKQTFNTEESKNKQKEHHQQNQTQQQQQ